jgi:predicted DNA-binding transcriptional regulator AlpA
MRVISISEAANRAGIVRRSLERLFAKGEGPAVVHISDRRRGILESDFENWLLSRRRPAPGEGSLSTRERVSTSEPQRPHVAAGRVPDDHRGGAR